MSKKIDSQNDHSRPSQLLDLDAQRLAEQHRQRLHQMTRAAIYGDAATSRKPHRHAAWLPAGLSAAALFLFALVLVWQLPPDSRQNPAMPVAMQQEPLPVDLPAGLPARPPSELPSWVRDTEVPVAVLENVEFYRWLAQQMQADQTASRSRVEAYYEDHS